LNSLGRWPVVQANKLQGGDGSYRQPGAAENSTGGRDSPVARNLNIYVILSKVRRLHFEKTKLSGSARWKFES
jgi:hypothetical protein